MCSISGCLERQQVGQPLRELLPLNFWARIQFIHHWVLHLVPGDGDPSPHARETGVGDDDMRMMVSLSRCDLRSLAAGWGHLTRPWVTQRHRTLANAMIRRLSCQAAHTASGRGCVRGCHWPSCGSPHRILRIAVLVLPRWPCNHLSQTQLRACRLCLILSGLFDDSLEFAGQLFVSAGDVRDPARDAACFPVIGTSQGTS
jgi:hypothetical protein